MIAVYQSPVKGVKVRWYVGAFGAALGATCGAVVGGRLVLRWTVRRWSVVIGADLEAGG